MTDLSSPISQEDVLENLRRLRESGLDSPPAHNMAAGIEGSQVAVEQWLAEGWPLGLEADQDFEGQFLQSYFQTVGLTEPAALTYIKLRAAGWPTYATRELAERAAGRIRQSNLFDADIYAARVKLSDRLDPALHYVLVGEQMGYAPSDRFDPVYYRKRYPDIDNTGSNFLCHYLDHGLREGRRPLSQASTLPFDVSRLSNSRNTVLLISHQASRTGAPILAYNIAIRLRKKYNVVAVLLSGGELVDDFRSICTSVVGPFRPDHEVECDYLVERLVKSFDIFYVIANSIDSRDLLKPLTGHLVPVVTLVHEFPSYLKPKGSMGRALEWSTEIVFSAASVVESVRTEYPNIANRRYHILPQGPSALPPVHDFKSLKEQEKRLRRSMRPPGFEDALIVLGCGTIYMRKGVDLFLSCAAGVAAMKPKRRVRFVWIGQRLEPHLDGDYYNYLSEQIRRSSLEDHAVILDEVSDLNLAYSLADVFFLSSRLDPLPNVAIDSAIRGLPIVCFENAGGMAEILSANAVARTGVVPHLDVHAAASATLA